MNLDAGIRKRMNAYQFRVCVGYTPSGKQIEKTRTWHPPEGTAPKKADKLAREAYIEFKRSVMGAAALRDNMRFKELVEWYTQNYSQNLKAQTWAGYNQKLNAYLLPEFGNRKLRDFSPAILTEFYRTVTGKRKEQLSYSTLKSFQKVMNAIFTCAVQQGFIEKNPCKNAFIPKPDSDSTEIKRYYMTPEETKFFLHITEESTQDNAIYRLLLYTGLRIGECLALQWQDIDFVQGFIHIRRNLIYTKGETRLSTTKTKSSMRTIAISPSVDKILHEQKQRHMEIVHVLGKRVQHPEMVFISPATGNYVIRNALSSRFHNLTKDTQISFMTLHMLRHSNASLLINAGVDIKIISEHLGHNEIGTTADVYADIFASTKQATAAIIDESLEDKKNSNNGQITVNSNVVKFKFAK